MTRILLAGVTAAALCGASAFAADLPVKAPYMKAPMSVYDWTGFYVGANAGVGVSQTSGTAANFEGLFDRGDAGFAGGVQAGYNWQFSPAWVAGIEGDIGYLGINRSSDNWSTLFAFGVKTDWYGTLRGRLGYTNGPSLFYVTGGAAFVHVKNNFDLINPRQFLVSQSETATGWTVGGGIETLLGGNWSAKAEYLYVDAGSQDLFNSASAAAFLGTNGTAQFDNRFHIYRYGLNYKFGAPTASGPLPAHNWTGLYVGANAGAGLSQSQAATPTSIFPGAVDIADAGFTGGVQAGYNWQFSSAWVAGLEGDINYLGIKRSFVTLDNPLVFFGVKTDWYGTLRGRLGYSTGPALLYVTGGAAFVKVKNNFDNAALAPPVFASKSETATGWTLGGGIEAALAGNWTAKTEYLYIDAGSQEIFNQNTLATAHFDNRFHVFRAGLNYKFGGY